VATPIIVVNSTGGSDTAASGAGPGDGTTAGSALTGTAGSTSSDGLTVTLDGSPDLSAVATDGSHVIFVNDSTAGHRNFSKITAADNTAKTVAVADAFTASLTGKSWAIGGKRASFASASSWRLLDNNNTLGDAMPGWIVEFASGHAETVASGAGPLGDGVIRFRRAGDTTSGPIVLRGKPGFATRPILTFGNNSNAIHFNSSYTQAAGLELKNSNATKTASVALLFSTGLTCSATDIKIGDSANKFWKGAMLSGASMMLRDLEIGYTASHGIDTGGGTYIRIRNAWIHNCTGTGVNIPFDPTTFSIKDSIVANNAAGLVVAGLANSLARRIEVEANVFDSNTGAAVDIQSANDGINGLSIANNVLSNNSHGVKFSAAGATDALLAAEMVLVSSNDTYNNSAAAYLGATGSYAYNNCPWASNDPGLDPQFANSAGGNYAVGTNLKAKGYPPSTRTIGANQSGTTSYVDVGVQRQEAGGGGTTDYIINQTINRYVMNEENY
jgi:hypothetical protein